MDKNEIRLFFCKLDNKIPWVPACNLVDDINSAVVANKAIIDMINQKKAR